VTTTAAAAAAEPEFDIREDKRDPIDSLKELCRCQRNHNKFYCYATLQLCVGTNGDGVPTVFTRKLVVSDANCTFLANSRTPTERRQRRQRRQKIK
jgi:hypothetical protein